MPSRTAQEDDGVDEVYGVEEKEFDGQEKRGVGRYISWSRLLRRVFDLDLEKCPNCGCQVKVVSAIEEPGAIRKILTHLGLSPHPPPRASARYDSYEEADIYVTY